MLDLNQYTCLGSALRAALDCWPNEVCLIEADRDREKVRMTYSDFKEVALPFARALQDAEFKASDRAAIIMDIVDKVAKAHKATPMQVALAWLLQRSPKMLTIPGTSSVKHLEENLGRPDLRLSKDEYHELANVQELTFSR